MIRLSIQEENDLKSRFPYVKVKKEKVFIALDNETVIIPSDLYPLQNKKHIRLFFYENTKPIEHDPLMTEAFDSVEFLVGRCYTNIMKLVDALLNKGVPKQDVQPYVGWIIINGIPIHHCWLVYKDVHLLDGGVSNSDVLYYQTIQQLGITDREQQRRVLADFFAKEKGKPNSEVKTFGHCSPLYLYVGSKCSPMDGSRLFRDLVKKYPDHPSYSSPGMNGKGMSRMQEFLKERSLI